MVFSDLFMSAGWGLINPILAVYIIKNVKNGDVEVAGIAIGIYWLLKSILQIPIARYLDKNHGEKDDYLFLVVGTFLASLTPLGFIFAYHSWHIYLLQMVHACGTAMAVPAWSAIFTRHIKDGQEAFSWSLDSSSIGLGSGFAGLAGGVVAKVFGFIPLFVAVSVFGLIATLLFLLIGRDMLPKTRHEQVYPMPKHL